VFVTLGIRHAMRVCHIVICGLSGGENIFSQYFINGKIFGEKFIESKMFVLISLQLCVKQFSI